jgi:hypothetical protein
MESFPRKRALLATTVDPFEEYANGTPEKFPDRFDVEGDSIVLNVPLKFSKLVYLIVPDISVRIATVSF